jgi:hypothetical protein
MPRRKKELPATPALAVPRPIAPSDRPMTNPTAKSS